MNIHYATLNDFEDVHETVVVIDVIRAFTTAAVAFAAGAREILPTGTVEEALALGDRIPDAVVMGHAEAGLPPEGFDFGNSPSALIGQDFHGRTIVQRTGAGTQGLVACTKANTLLAASFPCAGATARYLQGQNVDAVTFLLTGDHKEIKEDEACARYIAAVLMNEYADPDTFLTPVRDGLPKFKKMLREAAAKIDSEIDLYAEFVADLDCCLEVDRYDFVMVATERAGMMSLEARVQ